MGYRNRLIKYVILVMIFITNITYSQLYTEYTTPNELNSFVQNMFGSENVQIYNIEYTGYHIPINNDLAPIKNIGFFDGTNSTISIDSGVILTGGFLAPPYGLGQPSYNVANFYNTLNTDSILNSISTSIGDVVGVAILEFDFVPNGDSIKFNYVFASDEYPHQVCHYDNDIFAFHISGPGIVGFQNIALVPNTNFPVGNNSINDTSLHYDSSVLDVNSCQSVDNSQYYVDHTGDTTFIFNGSTTVLSAVSATIPCETYHLRFAIGEGNNSPYENSAVFIEANSFNSEPLSIESSVSYGGEDTVLFEGCGYAELVFRRTYNLQQPKTYTLNISGSAQNGIDFNQIPQTFTMPAGVMYDTLVIIPYADFIIDDLENIILTIGDTLCNGNFFETDIELIIHEKPQFEVNILPENGAFCDTVLFTPIIIGAIEPLTYNWNNNLSNDSLFTYFPIIPNNFITENIKLEVEDACGNSAKDSVFINFSNYPKANFLYSPNYSDIYNSQVEFTDSSTFDVVLWNWYFDNTFSSIQNPNYTFLDTGNYAVKLRVKNQFNCSDSITKIIRINDVPTLYIPNAFTPNNDGLNDEFKIIGGEIEEMEILIYNRFGELIFESNSQSNSWIGNNSLMGVYTYKLKITFTDGKKTSKMGHVTLIR